MSKKSRWNSTQDFNRYIEHMETRRRLVESNRGLWPKDAKEDVVAPVAVVANLFKLKLGRTRSPKKLAAIKAVIKKTFEEVLTEIKNEGVIPTSPDIVAEILIKPE